MASYSQDNLFGDPGFIILAVALLLGVSVIPWIVAGWFRIVRYMGYFQLEEYQANRYLQWLLNCKVERRHFLRSLLLTVAIPVAVIFSILFPLNANFLCFFPLINIVLPVIVSIYSAPATSDVALRFDRTPHALRLIVIGAIVQTLLPFIVGIPAYVYLQTGQEGVFSWFLFGLAISGGILVYTTLPLIPLVANIVNRPIDRLLHVSRNAPTSQGSNL